MSNDSIPYRIERTGNKHSRAVYRDGEVVIRLARRLTKAQEQEHIESLLRRMVQKVKRHRARTPIEPFLPLLEGEESIDVTTNYGRTIHFELKPGSTTRARYQDDHCILTVSDREDRESLHRKLWSLLSKLCQPDIEERVHRINQATLSVHIDRVRISLMSSQWGSCSRKGTIALNTALLFLPEECLDYVIIHELAHRVHTDHSPKYWAVVEQHLPEYMERRRMMRGWRMPKLR